MQNEDIKQRRMARVRAIYGVDCVLQLDSVKAKRRATNLLRYGVEHPLQNPDVAEKHARGCYRTKLYVFSDGKEVVIQGYEGFALDDLVAQGYVSDDIVTSRSLVPEVWYTQDGKSRRYYADIWIAKDNLLVEVKSAWTLSLNPGKVEAKKQRCLALGYDYRIWVYDGKGMRVEIDV